MFKEKLERYLEEVQQIINRQDAREESYYSSLEQLILDFAEFDGDNKCSVTILPKATEAGNPDFRVWDGKAHITGYIEAKNPEVYQLEPIAVSEQLQRYLDAFPNLILTNFYEFRLYQYGLLVDSAVIGSPINATQMKKQPPLQQAEAFIALLQRFFSFQLPAFTEPKSLAKALALRTRFLKDEILNLVSNTERVQGQEELMGFYDSFKELLINNLSLEQFADLYAQTLTYGIFVARTRSENEFSRQLIFKYIPSTLGILKTIFKFISYDEQALSLIVLIEDLADILLKTDIQKILHSFYSEGRGSDPIVHFYETFLSEYDPKLREKRGVYYTPEPVVRYIAHSVHSILKSHFSLADGLAAPEVTILDPAAGTLTFPAEAIKIAIEEYAGKYGEGNIHQLIKNHILPHFFAIELMMAPYTVGHLKISYLLKEYGYEMGEDERFNLYLSNTLEPDTPMQISLPFARDISKECTLANDIKYQEPILVILGNPPYSYQSENNNAWTDSLLKTDIDGVPNYYTVDGKTLGEKNPKALQDDYVKFLRFAQWKIHKAGKGIVGMITNHGYLDNVTFRGMRQSLMQSFDEIYILDLHGNTKKKEKTPEGNKDENVFDIQQGTAILIMIKSPQAKTKKVYHHELFGLRNQKYEWLAKAQFSAKLYRKIEPASRFYLFKPQTKGDEQYLKWQRLIDIFPVNSVGVITARDKLTIKNTPNQVQQTIQLFSSLEPETARTTFNLGKDTRDWKISYAQKDLKDSSLNIEHITPILYRPFDIRYTYYTGKSSGFHCTPRNETMKHMLQDNVGLISVRQVAENEFNHAIVSDTIVDSRITLSNKGIGYLFPLYLYPDEYKSDLFDPKDRHYNISNELLSNLSSKWSAFEPEQLFQYAYAVLYSNQYRKRFAQYLRMDFPRIPITNDFSLFKKLADMGKELIDLHLLKSTRLDTPKVKYRGSGANNKVECILFSAKTKSLQINNDKHFEGITPEAWNCFIGGYQVLYKYLKDRKGMSLLDPIHYCKIATALIHTMELQAKIDQIIIPLLAE